MTLFPQDELEEAKTHVLRLQQVVLDLEVERDSLKAVVETDTQLISAQNVRISALKSLGRRTYDYLEKQEPTDSPGDAEEADLTEDWQRMLGVKP